MRCGGRVASVFKAEGYQEKTEPLLVLKWYRHGVKNHHEAPAWHRTEDRRRRNVKNFGGCGVVCWYSFLVLD
jgi:hypothetical protein